MNQELLDAIETALQTKQDHYQDTGAPVGQAIAYALAGKGKRVRPYLTLLFCQAAGGQVQSALPFAVSVELVHLYSLIHDDLPCMDDDELRRGRPTVHVKYNEAQALLAGDGLLTDALHNILESDLALELAAAACKTLAAAAGTRGMVEGQSLDLHWTARSGATRADLDRIHQGKTAALIAAACELGVLSAGCSEDQRNAAKVFGSRLGLAFQIRDDLIDAEQSTGKTAGKDAAAGKLTYLSHMTRAEAENEADRLLDEAIAIVKESDLEWSDIVDFAEQLRTRKK